MRVRSFLALMGFCGLGCGGSTTAGVSTPSASRDLGGFVVTSQASAPDAAVAVGATLDASAGTACGTVTAAGTCSGNALEYCDPMAGLVTTDCSAQGLSCKVSAGMADCVASTGGGGMSGCGNVTEDGSCSGDTLTYCSSSGTLVTKDCSASNKSCKVLSSGYAECK